MGKYDAQERWKQENTKLLPIRLNKGTDADILKHLENQKSKSGYIKALIRRDMEMKGIEYEHIGKRAKKQYEKYLQELENGGQAKMEVFK